MKILQLELERYGHFTDKILNFRPDASLHVVYGPNEAGKSSSLDALADLLFSFPVRTQYDFLHDKTKLSLGATIKTKDGRCLTFKRRKGIKNTLLDAQAKPLSDDVLLPFLGSVTRPVFLNAFGLSKESLRAGAEEMLKNGGEAGSSLIAAASGLKGLTEVRKRLESEALAIFAPTKAQHRTFYQAKERYEAAARQIRELELRDRDLKDKRARIATLQDELKTVKGQRSQTIQRREFLLRQREIGPLLHEIEANEDLLETYATLPPMDASRIAQLRRAFEQLEKFSAELQRLRNELTGAKATAEAFVVNAPLIALGPAITALVSDSGNYSAEKAQLPRIQAEADGFRKKLEEYRSRLGLPAGADLSELRPSDLVIVRVKERITEGRRLETNLSSLSVAFAREQEAHNELLEKQVSQAAAGDPKPLKDRLTRLMPALSRLPEVARLVRATAKDSDVLREKAVQLSPAVLDLDAIAQMSLPSSDTIAEFAGFLDSVAKELSAYKSTLSEIDRGLPVLRGAVIDSEHENLESTPERIAAIRTVRTDLWKPFRSVLLRESDPLPVGKTADRIIEFEGSVDNADRLADDAVKNADRLANRAAALKRLQEEQDRRQRVADLYEGKELALSRLETDWQSLWKAKGFVASKPRRMEGWLSQVNDLLERRAENREERRTLAELKGAIADVNPALQELARLVGIPEADKLPAEVLLSGIQDEIEKRAEAWRKSREVVALAEASENRIEELEDQRIALQNAEREWKKSWIQVMAAMNLSPETALDEASAALEIWQQVPAALSQLEDRNRRVLGMKRDMEGFETRTSALFAQLGELEMGIGSDAAIKTIAARLNKAQQTESMAVVANRRVNDLRSEIVTAEANVTSTEDAFEALCAGLPPSTHRSEQIAELEARESILGRLRQQRQTLVPLSRGRSEAELRAALESFDDAAAVAEIEELNSKESHQNQDENEFFASFRQAENELAALQNGTGAEIALQLRKNAETQLVNVAREWGVKRIAQILLSHAIELFRSRQEQPLLKRASELFSLLTAGSFAGIEQEFDENDAVQLVGRRDADHTVCVPAMSEGTRDQLYLALRLSYLEDYAKNAEPMPFIGDDLLTNFDDERTQKGIAALAAIGNHIQPILFTHHHRVVELAQSQLGESVDIIALQQD